MSTALEMHKSRLVQRLQKPHVGTALLGPDNPFAFGGGLRNGGLSDEAMGLLRGIFAFGYMGAAEFEFGAVPKALQAMAESADTLRASSFTVPLRDVPPNWRDKSGVVPEGEATVFVLCREVQAAEVETRVRRWAAGEERWLKERTNLVAALRPVNEWDSDTCGWLELDNVFFFFTDETMWRATADLFGAEADA